MQGSEVNKKKSTPINFYYKRPKSKGICPFCKDSKINFKYPFCKCIYPLKEKIEINGRKRKLVKCRDIPEDPTQCIYKYCLLLDKEKKISIINAIYNYIIANENKIFFSEEEKQLRERFFTSIQTERFHNYRCQACTKHNPNINIRKYGESYYAYAFLCDDCDYKLDDFEVKNVIGRKYNQLFGYVEEKLSRIKYGKKIKSDRKKQRRAK